MENPPLKIKISTIYPGKPFMRQAPHGKAEWDNCAFYINEEIAECDFWFVYGGLGKEESVTCPKENVVLITNEPPSVKNYKKDFTDQFGVIITCNRSINHPNVIYSQQALPWWVGHKMIVEHANDPATPSKTYDELQSIALIPKTKTLSVIASNKTFTRGHEKRHAFVKKLKEHFGDEIDIFGAGENEIDDKWDALALYKYSIVMENSSFSDYWTEKLADSFLALSYPLYFGCPNILNYFPQHSLSPIDISKPEEAIATIEAVIKTNTFENNLSELVHAKDLILNKYQIFPMLAEYANKHAREYTQETQVQLKPERIKDTFMEYVRKLPRKIKNKF